MQTFPLVNKQIIKEFKWKSALRRHPGTRHTEEEHKLHNNIYMSKQ